MQSIATINDVSPTWGWLVLFAWLIYQLYWPLHKTKIQQFHDDITRRFERIETGQVALAEEIDGLDEEKYKKIHGKEGLTTSELKEGD